MSSDVECAIRDDIINKLKKIEFDLSFYSQNERSNKTLPILETPTIVLLPSGHNKIGKSTRISELKIDLSTDDWCLQQANVEPAASTPEASTTNTMHRFSSQPAASTNTMARVNLNQLEHLMGSHEKMTISSVRHCIPSECNIQPYFSGDIAGFGILVHIDLCDVYICKNFIDVISRAPLAYVRISGMVYENGCNLKLTTNARYLSLDCCVLDGIEPLSIVIPYGCRFDVFDLDCLWSYNGKYASIVKTYKVLFQDIPPQSESFHTVIKKMVLEIAPQDITNLKSFMASFINILCNELLFYCHEELVDLQKFKGTILTNTNMRHCLQRHSISHTTNIPAANTEEQMQQLSSLFETMKVKQLAFNARMFEIYMVLMKSHLPPDIPIIIIECEFGSPSIIPIDLTTHKYLFLNVANTNKTYQHYNVHTSNDGKYMPLIDIPPEFDVHGKCQVICTLSKVPCGIMAHHPVLGSELEKYRASKAWYNITQYIPYLH